ncbi:hypothetical protein V2J09_002703 [Rumex salicifolius]
MAKNFILVLAVLFLIMITCNARVLRHHPISLQNPAAAAASSSSYELLLKLGFHDVANKLRQGRRELISADRVSPGGPDPRHHEVPPSTAMAP